MHGRNSDIYPAALKSAEKSVETLFPRQQPDGGLNDAYELPTPMATSGFIGALAAVYLAPESRFHRSPELLSRMVRAAENLRSVQRPDGTVDLPITNFGSPPDLAFVLEPVAVALLLLRAKSWPELRPLENALGAFIRRGAEALIAGGIHTPNHRWVVVSALARCHKLFPDPRLIARIDQWLAEGVDLDAEAQYNERSTGVYNPITNNVFVTAGRMLDRPALFEPVRENLAAMLYLTRPGGEVVTDISRRQDRFQRATMRNYYRAYRFLGRHYRDGWFAAMADEIERRHADQFGGELIYMLEMPELRSDTTHRQALPDDYEKFYPLAGLAHIRRGEWDATLLGGHSRFFSFRSGGAVIESVRFASGFFGKGQFLGAIEKRGANYQIEQELVGDYVQPLEPQDRRADGDWSAMPHARRARTNAYRLRSAVEFTECDAGFDLTLDAGGTDGVPLTVEITLRPGGRLTGDALASVAGIPNAHLLREGFATYELDGRSVRFGPGFRRHAWTQVRGAEPRLDGVTVYFTDFTPVKRTLHFRAT